MRFGKQLARHINLTLTRTVEGERVRIPFLGGVKAGVTGEPFLLDVLRHFLPDIDGAFVDVGANVGQTLIKLKAVDPKRRYFGFEPNPACLAYLDSLVQANDWDGVTLFPCALSDRTSIAALSISSKRATDAEGSLQPGLRPESVADRRIDVVALRYGDLEQHIDQPLAFLKVDVEGAELEVLRGMAAAIQRDKPIVAIEIWPYESVAERRSLAIGLLNELGYRGFVVLTADDRRWIGLKEVTREQAPGIDMHDYLAVPDDKLHLLAGIEGVDILHKL